MENTNPNVLTIVIPTRDRHDTLIQSVRIAMKAKVENVQILIVDNLCNPPVSSVINESKEVKIVRTDRRLSMSDNWRFGLTHVATPYVTFMGDDDILWGNKLSRLMPILKNEQLKILSWDRGAYYWSSFKENASLGTLLVNNSNQFITVETNKLFQNVYPKTLSTTLFPSLYNSIVNTTEIKSRLRNITDIIPKDSFAPDEGSAFVLTSIFDSFSFTSSPITISGISHHSTGMNDSAQEKFFSEYLSREMQPIEFQSRYPYVTRKGEVYVSILNELYAARDHLPHGYIQSVMPSFKRFYLYLYEKGHISATKVGSMELDQCRSDTELDAIDPRVSPYNCEVFTVSEVPLRGSIQVHHAHLELDQLAQFLSDH